LRKHHFFAENRQKSLKLVIITLIPQSGKFQLINLDTVLFQKSNFGSTAAFHNSKNKSVIMISHICRDQFDQADWKKFSCFFKGIWQKHQKQI
jgi:hypothetical protein